MKSLKYKGYEGTVEIDMENLVCRGKILFINDLVTYEALSPAGLQVEFEAAVNDYLETCAQLGRAAQKPLKGQFNVRIPPELHKKLTLRSLHDNVSQNEVVAKAIDAYLSTGQTNNTFNITVAPPPAMTATYTPGKRFSWEPTHANH